MPRRLRLVCTLAALALLAMPTSATAQAKSIIMITNTTGNCLWATVYSGAKIIRAAGFPGWVPPRHRGTFDIPSSALGQKLRVRTEVLSTAGCTEHDAAHPLAEDLTATVPGSLFHQAFEVRLTVRNTYFHLERTL